ncbi:helix-turn-helix domain-containing protein [Xylocopilactobacillus apicola]|uniref:HTH cro/C1-type domain-containing protein n=1 Tax=Xylocopilactobacillus apicola TaxID=2932184 RepID=A0AAU9D2R3_9LACO|nr:helix-turn-helix transcriptional regulator [Xylocopilactobacillus apicola]BDR58029.1 hypothetical protein XA3_04700 [Xylocopilactobacillus apicola]
MNHGQLLKDLRIGRGITQQQLADGISSQAALSRMEASGNIPSDLLLKFLNRLDIYLIEFFMLAGEENVTVPHTFLNQRENSIFQKEKADELIKNEMELYRKTGFPKHKINALSLKAAYSKVHDLPLENSKEITNEIKNHLLQFNSWFINDIILYTNLLFIFDNEFIKTHHRTILRSLDRFFLGRAQKHNLQIHYANNSVLLAFERHNWADLDFYLDTYREFLTASPESLNDRIMYSIFTKLRDLVFEFDEARYQNLIAETQIFSTYGLDAAGVDIRNLIDDCLTK